MSGYQRIKCCERCGKEYLATHTRYRYCEDCREIAKKETIQKYSRLQNKNRRSVLEAERREYIRNKLVVLSDFMIKRPDSAVLKRFYDIDNVSDVEIDRFFRKLIDEKLGV